MGHTYTGKQHGPLSLLASAPALPRLVHSQNCQAFKDQAMEDGKGAKAKGALGPPFHILCLLKKISGAVSTILPNENVGQSPNPQGLRMWLYLVTGSLQKKSSYNEVIKVALSQCDWCPYKRETLGTETCRGGHERIWGIGHLQAWGRSLEQSSQPQGSQPCDPLGLRCPELT